jgi:hypothetical protein
MSRDLQALSDAAGYDEAGQLALAEILDLASSEDRSITRLREIRALCLDIRRHHYALAGMPDPGDDSSFTRATR